MLHAASFPNQCIWTQSHVRFSRLLNSRFGPFPLFDSSSKTNSFLGSGGRYSTVMASASAISTPKDQKDVVYRQNESTQKASQPNLQVILLKLESFFNLLSIIYFGILCSRIFFLLNIELIAGSSSFSYYTRNG